MHDPYTSPFFRSDRKRNFQCRIYTEVDNGNAGSRGRGGTRKRYGIVQRGDINTITEQRVRVTFAKTGFGWIARCKHPECDAVMEVQRRTQL